MAYFFELEDLTFNMETLENYGALLGEFDFVDSEMADLTGWYQAEARDEYERIKGPLNARMRELLGDEKTEHFVENWRMLCVVIDNGELCPGRLRASKPA